MKELFSSYGFGEIATFIVTIALATKGFVTFWDWAVNRLKQIFNKQNDREKEVDSQNEKIAHNEQAIVSLINQYSSLEDKLDKLGDRLDILMQSDKDGIKAFITEKHHYYCYEKKYIDDFNLDCLEKRYAHYVDEGGNSFIKGFMEELRALPRQPE